MYQDGIWLYFKAIISFRDTDRNIFKITQCLEFFSKQSGRLVRIKMKNDKQDEQYFKFITLFYPGLPVSNFPQYKVEKHMSVKC